MVGARSVQVIHTRIFDDIIAKSGTDRGGVPNECDTIQLETELSGAGGNRGQDRPADHKHDWQPHPVGAQSVESQGQTENPPTPAVLLAR